MSNTGRFASESEFQYEIFTLFVTNANLGLASSSKNTFLTLIRNGMAILADDKGFVRRKESGDKPWCLGSKPERLTAVKEMLLEIITRALSILFGK